MSVIFHVLKEEEIRLQETVQGYEKLIEQMPKGSPRKKVVKNHEYLYLTYRESDKVKSQYIGEINSEKATSTIRTIEKRNRYLTKLRESKIALQEIRKVLRGKY